MIHFAANALQCTVIGEENSQNCPFPLGFCHPAGGGPSHGHTQHAQKFGKDRTWGSRDMLADRQTDRQTHTQTCSSQYFAAAPAGEVIKITRLSRLITHKKMLTVCLLRYGYAYIKSITAIASISIQSTGCISMALSITMGYITPQLHLVRNAYFRINVKNITLWNSDVLIKSYEIGD